MKHMRKLMALLLVVIMIMAMGVTAYAANDGSITLTNAAIGLQYNAYKLLDATVNGDKVAYTTKTPTLFNGTGSPWIVSDVADVSGNYSVTLASGKTVADITNWFISSNFTPITPTSGIDASNKANEDTIKWTNLAYGYYYITSPLGAAVTIDNATPSKTVVDKNETEPSGLTKTLLNDTGTVQIGDTVSFSITFTATNYVTSNTTDGNQIVTATIEPVTQYTVTDTMDGYTYVPNTLKVIVGGTEVTGITPTVVNETDSADGSLTFDIPWTDTNGTLYNYSEPVTITYDATVNGFGYLDSYFLNHVNEVTVTNNTGKETLSGSSSSVRSYPLIITKRADTETGTLLTGAQFELYRDGETTALYVLKIDETPETIIYRIAFSDEDGAAQTIDMTYHSSARIEGLRGDDGYSIKEIKAPDGYNKLDDPQTFVQNRGESRQTVVTLSGPVLPSTGGMGTTLFYILGGLMVVVALVVLVTNKRMRRT